MNKYVTLFKVNKWDGQSIIVVDFNHDIFVSYIQAMDITFLLNDAFWGHKIIRDSRKRSEFEMRVQLVYIVTILQIHKYSYNSRIVSKYLKNN